MKAFVHMMIDGKDTHGTYAAGGRGAFVTNEYANLKNLIRYSLKNVPNGDWHIEAFHNWDNRYGKPDIDAIVHKGRAFDGSMEVEFISGHKTRQDQGQDDEADAPDALAP
jgi:hypothetical protein